METFLSENDNETEFSYYPDVKPETHYIMGSILAAIGVAGVLGNSLVLFVFTRFRRLRGPFSSFIVNLAVADLVSSVLHSMAVISSFNLRWSFGRLGCKLYACGVGHFGLLSIVIISAIAVERYMVITSKPLSGSWKITQYGARKVCMIAWIYCFALSLPPLFGWSRYISEGFHTSCSWDYTTKTFANRAYYIYLLTFGFVVPVSVITYCYIFILAAIMDHGKEMAHVKASGGGTPSPSTTSRLNIQHSPFKSSIRTAEIILMIVILFLISWTPYAIITLIGQFGDPKIVTGWVQVLPAFFAKASVVYNPIVYGLSHPHFRASVKQYISSCTARNSNKSFASHRVTSRHRRHAVTRPALSSPPDTMPMHHNHFRCFRRTHTSGNNFEFHSEPDHRSLTLLVRSRHGTAVRLQWEQRSCGPSTQVALVSITKQGVYISKVGKNNLLLLQAATETV